MTGDGGKLRFLAVTSKHSSWGLKTFKEALRGRVQFDQRDDEANYAAALPEGFDGAFLHNTLGVSDGILERSVLYALQSQVRRVLDSPEVADRLRTHPPLEIWCNTQSAVDDLRRAGIAARVMYRPAPGFATPQAYVPLPDARRVLWYYDPEHKFMASKLPAIAEAMRAIRDVEILTFPHAEPPVDQPNIRALGRIDIGSWAPKVHGMVRISDRLDFGRSTFDVLAHGRWVLYYNMQEPITFSCEDISRFGAAIDALLAEQGDDPGRARFEAAKAFDLPRLAEVWHHRLVELARGAGPDNGEAPARPTYDRSFFDRQSKGSYVSAQQVIPLVRRHVEAGRVCDVGCGTGAWLRAWMESGASEIVGLDGDYVLGAELLIPQDSFRVIDLASGERSAVDAAGGRRFDLATSLEVAEHLPPERAASFVKELTELADAVLFSAAIPDQGGRRHVNERWQSYWISLFNDLGYGCRDVLRDALWSDAKVKYWYRQNVLLFVKGAQNDRTNLADYDRVHPACWERKVRKLSAAVEKQRAVLERATSKAV